MTKIAINGLGRIGKLVVRALMDDGVDAEIALLNDPVGTPEQHALLLELVRKSRFIVHTTTGVDSC